MLAVADSNEAVARPRAAAAAAEVRVNLLVYLSKVPDVAYASGIKLYARSGIAGVSTAQIDLGSAPQPAIFLTAKCLTVSEHFRGQVPALGQVGGTDSQVCIQH